MSANSVALAVELLQALEGILNMPPRRDTSRWACQERVNAKRRARQVATAAREKINKALPLLEVL
jgi:hypothetical protein